MNKITVKPEGLREMAEGIVCACCVSSVRDTLASLGGVKDVEVDHKGPLVHVSNRSREISFEEMDEAIQRIDPCTEKAGPYSLSRTSDKTDGNQ